MQITCFNPRPREGATDAVHAASILNEVSIHAPVKGRLSPVLVKQEYSTVSIHAPVKGRQEAAVAHDTVCGFNPRPREGATLP